MAPSEARPFRRLVFTTLAMQLLGAMGLYVFEGLGMAQSIYLSSKTMSTVGTLPTSASASPCDNLLITRHRPRGVTTFRIWRCRVRDSRG